MSRNLKTNLRLAGSGLVLAALMPANIASAQEAPNELSEIVVTGFRSSLATALETKRESVGVVDVINAEDIASFPDLNLAESLQRISGVAIDRDAGEGRSISVRGLGPQFTRVRINGMEALSTTGGTDSSGGANRDRGFDFNVFASELFNSLTVRKSSTADVDEGSLGATVDLRTARPFDFKGVKLAGSMQMGYSDLSKKSDPRATLLVSKNWDNTFGLLVSVAYQKRNLFEDGSSTVRWEPITASGGLSNTPAEINRDDVFMPRLPRYGRLVHKQERLGVTGAAQWAPTDSTRINFDTLHSKLNATRQENFLEAISFNRSGSSGKVATDMLDYALDDTNNVVYGEFNDVDIRSEARFDDQSTKFQQYSLEIEQDFGDNLHATFQAGFSKSSYSNPIQATLSLDRTDTDGYSWDFRDNDRLPVIDYGFDVSDPANWVFASGTSLIRLRAYEIENKFRTFRTDWRWDVTQNMGIKFGLTARKYDFASTENRRTQSETAVPTLSGSLADLTTMTTDFGKGLGLTGATPTTWLMPDFNAFENALGFLCYCDTGVANGDYSMTNITNGSARGGNRGAVEKTAGGYLGFDFKAPLGAMTLRGDLGVRYVKTKQEAIGYLSTDGGTEVRVNQDYDDFLPAINLTLEATDNFFIRAAAAKTMARPKLEDLNPGGSINANAKTITSGNPVLEPYHANTVDLAFEYYFAKESLISVGFFYKDIKTFIQNLRREVAYGETGFPLDALIDGQDASTIYTVTQPVNTSGGPLKGFEINYQQPFSFLPGIGKNFGFLGNFTYVKSTIEYATSPTDPTVIRDKLTGLSPKSWNATLYYEDEKFNARVTGSRRTGYLTRVPGQNANDVEGKNGTFNLDAKVGYKINDNFSLSLEAINLTDRANDQYVDSSNRLSVYTHTGRQFYFGGSFKF